MANDQLRSLLVISAPLLYLVIYVCPILNTTSNPEKITNVGYPNLPKKKKSEFSSEDYAKMAQQKPAPDKSQ